MTVTLHVCTTCKAGEPAEGVRPVMGARLHAALAAAGARDVGFLEGGTLGWLADT